MLATLLNPKCKNGIFNYSKLVVNVFRTHFPITSFMKPIQLLCNQNVLKKDGVQNKLVTFRWKSRNQHNIFYDEAHYRRLYYRRSPLVQGQLEIPCKVTIRMPDAIRIRNLIVKYKEIFELLYIQLDVNHVNSWWRSEGRFESEEAYKMFLVFSLWSYRPSYNLTPHISRVLIRQYLLTDVTNML